MAECKYPSPPNNNELGKSHYENKLRLWISDWAGSDAVKLLVSA